MLRRSGAGGAKSKPSREARSECQLRTQDGYEPAAHRTKSKGGAQPESQLRGQGGLPPAEKRRGSVGDYAQNSGNESKPSREARSECQRTQDGYAPAADWTKAKGGADSESQGRMLLLAALPTLAGSAQQLEHGPQEVRVEWTAPPVR